MGEESVARWLNLTQPISSFEVCCASGGAEQEAVIAREASCIGRLTGTALQRHGVIGVPPPWLGNGVD